jgi:hypothetical protein
MNQNRWRMHYSGGSTELKRQIEEMVAVAHFPHAERLRHGFGSIVGQESVMKRLENKGRPNESLGLQRRGGRWR